LTKFFYLIPANSLVTDERMNSVEVTDDMNNCSVYYNNNTCNRHYTASNTYNTLKYCMHLNLRL